MNEQCGEILNCADIKIALLVITHTIAPIDLLSSPNARHSHTKPRTKFEVTSSWRYVRSYAKNCRGSRDLRHAHFQGKLFVRPLDRYSPYKAAYQIWSL